MAKKSTRNPNVSAQALERARAEIAQGVATPTVATSAGKGAQHQVVKSFKKTMTRDELAHEYGYVIRDMQSMAILAVALFISMIVVSLVIL